MARPRASVVFRGPAPGPGPGEDLQRFGDRLAGWLLATLRQLGATVAEDPDMDGQRWTLDFAVEGARHAFCLEYRASGGGAGAWNGRVIRIWSFPSSLFRGRHRATAAAVGLVRRALAAAPEVSAISWHGPA